MYSPLIAPVLGGYYVKRPFAGQKIGLIIEMACYKLQHCSRLSLAQELTFLAIGQPSLNKTHHTYGVRDTMCTLL